MIVYIIAALLVFGILIAVHELGHFLAAKACGVRVNEFRHGTGAMEKAAGGYPVFSAGFSGGRFLCYGWGKRRILTIRRR